MYVTPKLVSIRRESNNGPQRTRDGRLDPSDYHWIHVFYCSASTGFVFSHGCFKNSSCVLHARRLQALEPTRRSSRHSITPVRYMFLDCPTVTNSTMMPSHYHLLLFWHHSYLCFYSVLSFVFVFIACLILTIWLRKPMDLHSSSDAM